MGFRILLLLLAILPCATAHADKTLIWGIHDRCERVPELDRTLDHLFAKGGLDPWLLSPAPSTCQGEDCAKRLLAQCPTASGRLIGGRIYRSKKTVRLRLWMYDLATHKTAYQDAICLDCLLSNLVPSQAHYLWQEHKWGPIPGPIPSFCKDRAAAPAPEVPWGRKLYLMVYGDGKNKHLVTTAMRELLAKSMRPVQVVSGDKGYGHGELVKIVGPAKDGKIVGIELQKDGGAALWLYDGPTEKIQQQAIQCPSCEADALNEVLKNNVIPLLAHCFEGDCTQGTSEPLPQAACEPLEEPTCQEEALPTPVLLSRAGMDPTLAKGIKGGLWGLFAASAATSIGLFAANETTAGTAQSTNGNSIGGALWNPAWATAGVSAGILAVSIPITILVDRAQKREAVSSVPVAATTPSALLCPR